MQPPTLTFACELDDPRLTALFDDPAVLADLQALRARVVLMQSRVVSRGDHAPSVTTRHGRPAPRAGEVTAGAAPP